MRSRISALLFLPVLAAASLAVGPVLDRRPGAAGVQPDAPVRRALLIGINDYQSPDVPKLFGAVNDIEAVAQVLATRYGFQQEQIKKLVNRNASRNGILAEFASLVAAAGPQDVVYIHYAGHGSQVQDLNGDEEDGLDETIVPYDGRTEKVPDITDDEIDSYLTRLRPSNVVVILDSCHSGTATRSISIRTRFMPRDQRVGLYRGLSPRTRDGVAVGSGRYVLLAAAASNQSALDGLIDGQERGFFSYALVKAISSLPEGTPVTTVMRHIESEIDRIKTQMGGIDMPSPQLEAQKDRLGSPMFPVGSTQADGTAAGRLPWVTVERAGAGRVRLKNAASLGAREGSVWWIYPPGEKDFPPGAATASARVLEVEGADDVAALQPPDSPIAPGSRAIIASNTPQSSDLPVHFRVTSSTSAGEIQTRLQKQLPQLRLVGAEAFARFIVSLDAAQCRVFGAAGLQVIDDFQIADVDTAVERLRRVFSRSVSSAELLALENPSSQIGLTVRVSRNERPQEVKEDARRGVRVVASGSSPQFRIRSHDEARSAENSLQLEITCTKDAYVTVVDVDQEGGVNLLFPAKYQKPDFYPQGRIGAGEPALIPDSLAPGNRAGFNWDMSAPPGLDTIRVFASSDLETAEMIRRYVAGIGAPDPSQSRGTGPSLSLVALNRSLSALTATRGIRVQANESKSSTSQSPTSLPSSPRDWNAASVTISVTK